MQALRAVAVRLQSPVLSTAWQSWQAYTARRSAKQVRMILLDWHVLCVPRAVAAHRSSRMVLVLRLQSPVLSTAWQ